MFFMYPRHPGHLLRVTCAGDIQPVVYFTIWDIPGELTSPNPSLPNTFSVGAKGPPNTSCKGLYMVQTSPNPRYLEGFGRLGYMKKNLLGWSASKRLEVMDQLTFFADIFLPPEVFRFQTPRGSMRYLDFLPFHPDVCIVYWDVQGITN